MKSPQTSFPEVPGGKPRGPLPWPEQLHPLDVVAAVVAIVVAIVVTTAAPTAGELAAAPALR